MIDFFVIQILIPLNNNYIYGIKRFTISWGQANFCKGCVFNFKREELGRKLGFVITAGSDFHGEKIRNDRRLGHTCGGKKIDDKYYFEELLKVL